MFIFFRQFVLQWPLMEALHTSVWSFFILLTIAYCTEYDSNLSAIFIATLGSWMRCERGHWRGWPMRPTSEPQFNSSHFISIWYLEWAIIVERMPDDTSFIFILFIQWKYNKYKKTRIHGIVRCFYIWILYYFGIVWVLSILEMH